MSNKSVVSRKEKAEQTRQKIYQSAEELFYRHGFDEVNVDNIVRHAGVAKGSFYVHFESKNALIATLIQDYVDRVDMKYQSYLDTFSPEEPADKILLSLVKKIAEILERDIGVASMRNLYRVQLSGELDTRPVKGYSRDLYKMLREVVDRGLTQKIFHSALPAEELTRQLLMAYRGLTYEWCIRYPDYNLEEEAVRHFELLLKGILVSDGDKP